VNSGSEDDPTEHKDWERWLESHARGLLFFARQQTRCEQDAQDLVQDAVVECWKRHSGDSPPPLSLVYATIRRRAIDLARKDERRAGREAAVLREEQQIWFDSGVEERERDRLLQEAMNNLPLIYREVVALKVWGGLSFAEIAAALEVPANTAASRYRYGLVELRKLTKGRF